VYAATFEDDLKPLVSQICDTKGRIAHLEGIVVAIYAVGSLGVLVAYFVLRVEVSLRRVVMTLFSNTSFTNTAAESVAASACGSK
jgi:hypothetical protein